MYEQYLRNLLEPLRVYDLDPGSLSGSELDAAGAGMDAVSRHLDEVEREALTSTAEGEGLSRREALFARKPAAQTPEQRRMALAALTQIDGDSLTLEAINRTICGCGIRARAEEVDTGHLQVWFPDTVGKPEGFEQIREIILDILPCHLETEFYFCFLTWQACEQAGMTWNSVESTGHSWDSFQETIPGKKTV